MTQRWWKLSSFWDPPPAARDSRHAIVETDELLDRFDLTTRPQRVRKHIVVQSERKLRLEDFPFCSVPIWSERAAELLKDLVLADGDLVPVDLRWWRSHISRYFLFNCRRAYPRGGRPGVRPKVEYQQVPNNVNAFRDRDWPEVIKLMVSESVVQRLVSSDLSGWSLAAVSGAPRDPKHSELDAMGERLMNQTIRRWKIRQPSKLPWLSKTVISPFRP